MSLRPPIKIPEGNNNLDSKTTFAERAEYELYVEMILRSMPDLTLVNLRKKTLYGKINLKNQVVAPIPSKMVLFGGTVRTFDFIADALQDFSDALDSRLERGRLNAGTPYSSLQLRSRTSSWEEDYSDYIEDVREKFMEQYLADTESYNSTHNFRQFLALFLDFCANNCTDSPISFSRYNISKHSDLFTTGIVFDMGTEQYGNDYVSCKKYFEDSNFGIFSQEAQNHGFILDRHAPWRFVANLSSEPMIQYMKNREYRNLQSVFNELYFNPVNLEFYEIVKSVVAMYAETFPLDDAGNPSTYASICHRDGKTSYTLKPRDVFDLNDFSSVDEMIDILGINDWIRAFAFIKAVELNQGTTQQEFEDIVKEAQALNKHLDIQRALGYISDRFNPLKVSFIQGSPTIRF